LLRLHLAEAFQRVVEGLLLVAQLGAVAQMLQAATAADAEVGAAGLDPIR
jgi:hypothetical protein